jgi:hypothetical protein
MHKDHSYLNPFNQQNNLFYQYTKHDVDSIVVELLKKSSYQSNIDYLSMSDNIVLSKNMLDQLINKEKYKVFGIYISGVEVCMYVYLKSANKIVCLYKNIMGVNI